MPTSRDSPRLGACAGYRRPRSHWVRTGPKRTSIAGLRATRWDVARDLDVRPHLTEGEVTRSRVYPATRTAGPIGMHLSAKAAEANFRAGTQSVLHRDGPICPRRAAFYLARVS